MQALAGSPQAIFSGSLSLLTNFGLQYMTQDLQHFARELFRYSIARKGVLLAVLYSATRSWTLSLIMTIVIIGFNWIAQRKHEIEASERKAREQGTQTQTPPLDIGASQPYLAAFR